MSRTKRRTTVAVLTAAAAALTVGLSAAPASAATTRITARLTVTPSNFVPGRYDVAVSGIVLTSTIGEAYRHIRNGYRVFVTIMGEDVFSDDVLGYRALLTPRAGWSGGPGLLFRKTWIVPSAALNEDVGGDEIYAAIRLTSRDGRLIYLNGRSAGVVEGSF